jgi:hypothetical protein
MTSLIDAHWNRCQAVMKIKINYFVMEKKFSERVVNAIKNSITLENCVMHNDEVEDVIDEAFASLESNNYYYMWWYDEDEPKIWFKLKKKNELNF